MRPERDEEERTNATLVHPALKWASRRARAAHARYRVVVCNFKERAFSALHVLVESCVILIASHSSRYGHGHYFNRMTSNPSTVDGNGIGPQRRPRPPFSYQNGTLHKVDHHHGMGILSIALPSRILSEWL